MTTLPYATALVTGAAVRIGRAIAHDLARRGIAVAIHHRNSHDAAHQLADTITSEGGTAALVSGDLAEAETPARLMSAAADALGQPVSILVNNASVFEDDAIENVSAETWDRHQATNLRAPVLLSQAMARQLPDAAKGCIINMVDQRVLKLNPQFFSYTVSKSGLWTVTRTMAQALAPRIRVNAISPGPTLANQFQAPEDFEAEASSVPLGKGPGLSEITNAVKFLLETPSMTGQMLTLDGGQHLAWRTEDIAGD